MIDAKALVAAHEALKMELQAAAVGDREPSEPVSRQFPLAGQTQVRPLADPARRNPASKE